MIKGRDNWRAEGRASEYNRKKKIERKKDGG